MLASKSAAGFSQYAAAANRAAATPSRARTTANSSSASPISAASPGSLTNAFSGVALGKWRCDQNQ